MRLQIGLVTLMFAATAVGSSGGVTRSESESGASANQLGPPPVCEHDDCDELTIPNLNDPLDTGDCDAGLLGGPCSRPFSNVGCDDTVIATLCFIDPRWGFAPFGSDTWMRAIRCSQERLVF